MEAAVRNRSTVDVGTKEAVRAGAEDEAADASDVQHLRRWLALRRKVFMGLTVYLLPLTVVGGLDRSPP